jgi:endonuclease YncB( thermonuclease family)
VVVWSRLTSSKAKYLLVGFMAISSLMAQGAWTQWMVASAFTDKPNTQLTAETPLPTPDYGAVAGASTHNNSSQEAQVTRVIDGAHIEVTIFDQLYVVELIGLSTIDSGSHESPPACFGQESQRYLQGLLSNPQVQLATDGQLTDRNDYGQMLRYVTGPDGSLVNRQMIDAGMAMVQAGEPAYEQQVAFLSAQEAAKAASRGLWGSCLTNTIATPTPTPSLSGSTTSSPTPTTYNAVNVVPPTPTPTPTAHKTPTPTPTPSPTPTPAVSLVPTSAQDQIVSPTETLAE